MSFKALTAIPLQGMAVFFLPFARFTGNNPNAGENIKLKKLLTILLLLSVCSADIILIPERVGAEVNETMDFALHTGLRRDNVDWNIGGNNSEGQYVNVLSELEWEDLEILEIGAHGKLSVGNLQALYRTYIWGSVDYGWINGGTGRDSDYHGNDRTLEVYRWYTDTEDDNVFDASIGLGIEKKYWQDRVTLGLLGGYSYHEQNLRLTNGVQVIPDSMPLDGLDSTYESKWHGPFAGVDIKLQPLPHVSLYGLLEYHWSDYRGEADWNLRSDLAHPVSFSHEADNADGLAATLQGSYHFSRQWALDLSFLYRSFSAKDGIDLTYMASGATLATRLNEVNWQSSAVTVGLSYRY